MDKTLFKAYVRELVKEEVEAQVVKILPKLLAEAVAEIKSVNETSTPRPVAKAPVDRGRLAELMGLEYPAVAAGNGNGRSTKIINVPEEVEQSNPAVAAINKDYSAVMKKLGLTK